MRIGRIYGIEIKLHISTLLIVGLVGFYAATLYNSLTGSLNIPILITIGIINGFIMLFSILAHEIMHSIVAQKYGLNVSEIELYVLGGVSKIEEEPRTPKSEFIIAVVGPLTSMILGGILIGIVFLPINYSAFIFITLFYAGFSNITLGIFNLLPAFPIDGGRLLRSFLWYRRKDLVSATRTASKIGVFFGYGLIFFGVLQSLFLGLFNGFWLFLIGLFLISSAKNAYKQVKVNNQLSQFNAHELSKIPDAIIPFNTFVSDAIRNYFMRYNRDYFPVSQGNKIIGIVSIEDIKNISPEMRQRYIIGYLAQNLDNFPTIYESERGDNVMNKINTNEMKPNLLIVKSKDDDNHIIGFISPKDLSSAIKLTELKIEG
ncbi:MAG: site-2 protease family protein [Promethearchaeota archaeon]|nr:MAG: site-2 protease family protein [Candidatus Lokiarchaeota archaeon]